MERLYLLWLKITKDPMHSRNMRGVGIGLLLLAVLAATIVWSVYGQPEKKSAKISELLLRNSGSMESSEPTADDPTENQKAQSEIEFQIETGDVHALKTLLNDLLQNFKPNADPATYLDQLKMRRKIVLRLDDLIQSKAEREFLVQQKLMLFIENATASQRYKLDDSDKIKNVMPILKQADEYEASYTRSLAAFAEIVVEIRTYLRSKQEDGTKRASQWADRLRLIGADSMNEFALAYRIYNFIGELWENREYEVAFPLMFAYVDAFSGSNNDIISSRAGYLRNLAEDRKQQFDKIKSRENK